VINKGVEMDYFALAKRAYKLTIENKFLWIFGLLAGSVGTFTGYRFNSFGSSEKQDINEAELNQLLEQLKSFYLAHTMTILTVALIFLLLMVLFFVLSIISQGALISSVAKLNKQEKVDFWKGLKEGTKYFWKMWGLMIAFSMIILVVLLVLSCPLLLTIATSNIILTILWAIIALVLFFLVCLVISFIGPYSQCLVVLKNEGVIESIKNGLEFVRQHLGNLLIVYFMLIAISVIFGIIIALVLGIIAAILIMAGIAIGLASVTAGSIFALACIIAFILMMFVIMGAFNAYQTAVVTLAYEQLKHKAA